MRKQRKSWKGTKRTFGRNVPQAGAKTSCNCPDGSYSESCCDSETLWAFGIGNIIGEKEI